MRYRSIAGQTRHMAGYRPNTPHAGDVTLVSTGLDLPPACEIDDSSIPIFDQGNLGSCVANGACFQAAWLEHLAGNPRVFSRLFLYALAREMEGVPLSEDSGLAPRDAFSALARYGVCEESLWPYDTMKFSTDPPEGVKGAALDHKAVMFFGIKSVDVIKQSIVDRFPVGFGFTCYDVWDSATAALQGLVPLPEAGEQTLGSHYTVVTGYDDSKVVGQSTGACKVRNSYGKDWGLGGYFWLPYDYWLKGLALDSTTLRRVML